MEYLSKENWNQVAEKCLGTSTQIVDYRLDPIKSTGGFLGEYFSATVTVKNRRSQPVLRFFVKCKPKNFAFQKELVESIGGFDTESLALQVLFPEFRSALQDGGDGMEWTCKCYFVSPEALVLEDLSVQGFSLIDRRNPVKYKHIELTLTCVANLHSASLIYEETRPNQPFRISSVYPHLNTAGFFREVPGEPGTEWINSCFRSVLAVVELLRGKDYVNRMRNNIEKALNSLFIFQKPSKKFRNLLGQGDLKRDNILFQHDNGEPVQARLVDFQLVRYMPPANDVMCLLHISTNRKFRDKYESRLLKHYYSRFSENLQRHGIDAEKVLSWREFKESCTYYKALGIIISTCYGPYTLMKTDNLNDVFSSNEKFEDFVLGDRVPVILSSFKTDTIFKDDMTEIMEEFLEYVENLDMK